MRAVVIERFGDPDVLTVRTVPRPEPGSRDVRIRVEAVSINLGIDDQVLPLCEASRAHRLAEARGGVGKILLDPRP